MDISERALLAGYIAEWQNGEEPSEELRWENVQWREFEKNPCSKSINIIV